ncbi:MAG: thioredoxin domain-containing protein [Nanoarchaeota archaeon]
MENQATPNKGFFQHVRSNPWMLSTIVLVVLLGFMVVAGGITGNAVFSGSKSSVGESTLEYLNGQVDGGVVLKSVEEESGLYKVTVTYQGQDIPVYVTKDGKNLVSSLVPLDGSAPTTGNTGTPSGPVDIDYAKLSHEPSIGSADAPVTIVEFSDFSCPFCGAASGDSVEYVAYMKQNNPSWESPVQGIMENYVKTGKVRFILAYFPGHGTGVQAQLVGWCLNEQSSDAFWKYHDLVFAVQDKTDDLEAMKDLAKQAGGNANVLNACLTAKKYDSYIQSDTDYGRQLGVSGTPAFYVNGQLVSGAVPFSDIQATIEAELAKSA